MRRAAPVLVVSVLLGAWAALSHCANLTPLTPNVCGDGVVNAGEDCDGFADASAGQACGAADAGVLACRYTCAKNAACPSGYNCGVDQVCRAPTGAFVPLGARVAVGAVGVMLADFNGDGFADALTNGQVNSDGESRVQVNYLASTGAVLGTFGIADKLSYPSIADINGDGIADLVAAQRLGSVSGVSFFLGGKTNALGYQPFASAVLPTSNVRVLQLTGFPNGATQTVYFAGSANGGGIVPGLYVQLAATLPNIAGVPTGPLPEGPDDVEGEVTVAQVFTGATLQKMPVSSLVYQTRSGLVRVVSPRIFPPLPGVTVSTLEAPLVTTVTLPQTPNGTQPTACVPNGRCASGVRVADVDGDGAPDLLVSATDAAGEVLATYVAYGDGTGAFGPTPMKGRPQKGNVTGGAFTVALQTTIGGVATAALQETYAAGDINGDGLIDFVARIEVPSDSSMGAYVTLIISAGRVATAAVDGGSEGGGVDSGAEDAGATGAPEYEITTLSLADENVVLGDFNGDGHVDVLGGSDSASGLKFFDGASLVSGDFVPHEFAIETAGPTSDFVVSDFDGDGILDLAFVQPDPANDGSVDVDVSYGNASGPPGVPLSLGRFASVAQLSATPPYSQLDVIGVPLGPSTATTLTQLTTNAGGRPPLSSQALTTTDAGTVQLTFPQLAYAAVAGTFTASLDGGTAADGGPLPSVAALGRAIGRTFLWRLPVRSSANGSALTFGSAIVNASPLTDSLAPDLELNATADHALLLAAAPLSATTHAMLVEVASNGSAAADAGPPATRLLVAGASSSGLSPIALEAGVAPTLSVTTANGGTLFPSVASDGQLALRDMDGDGFADIVLLTGTTNECQVATLPGRYLLVYWGDGTGNFNVTNPAVVASCAVSCVTSSSATCPRAFTTLVTDKSARPTLAYVTNQSVYFAEFSGVAGHARQLLPLRAPVSTPIPADAAVTDASEREAGSPLPTTTGGYTGIAGGDINGDGIDDLAVVLQGSLYLFAGTAVNP